MKLGFKIRGLTSRKFGRLPMVLVVFSGEKYNKNYSFYCAVWGAAAPGFYGLITGMGKAGVFFSIRGCLFVGVVGGEEVEDGHADGDAVFYLL